MLTDYEIKQKPSKLDQLMPIIEFILILIILQSIIFLFSAGVNEKDEAIRFRLLAHSNTAADQNIKEKIQVEIEPLIQDAVEASKSVDELGHNLKVLEAEIVEIASSLSNGKEITLERREALFPPKRAGFFVTPQADYDAYILTIGSGRGDNWWCALFPKVCFVDEKVEEEEKVTFFIVEWFKGLFSESY